LQDDRLLHLVKLQALPFLRHNFGSWGYVFEPVVVQLVLLHVYSVCGSSIPQFLRHNMSPVFNAHPRVNPYFYFLFIYRLVIHKEFMVDLKCDDGGVLNVKFFSNYVTEEWLVGPNAYLVLAEDSMCEVDCLPVGHVGDAQVRHPNVFGHGIDHVDATPIIRIPTQFSV